jgi:hypothetical protein
LRRKSIASLLAAVIITAGIASPASAATRFNQVAYGSCGGYSNQFYNSLSGYIAPDGVGGGAGYAKYDFTTFKAGGKFALTGCNGLPTKICHNLTVAFTTSGTIATTAPFGTLGAYWPGSHKIVGQVATFTGSQICQNVSSRTGNYTISVPDNNFFIYAGGNTGIIDAKITLTTSFYFSNQSTVSKTVIADVV